MLQSLATAGSYGVYSDEVKYDVSVYKLQFTDKVFLASRLKMPYKKTMRDFNYEFLLRTPAATDNTIYYFLLKPEVNSGWHGRLFEASLLHSGTNDDTLTDKIWYVKV
ncbi:hypothetical protein [Pontibacter sp. H249]|uniref:hypothetical protein n=1 Tax=Pontibacter sp. H249 TaxID=3133420 RepID=UPI0030BBCD8A